MLCLGGSQPVHSLLVLIPYADDEITFDCFEYIGCLLSLFSQFRGNLKGTEIQQKITAHIRHEQSQRLYSRNTYITGQNIFNRNIRHTQRIFPPTVINQIVYN